MGWPVVFVGGGGLPVTEALNGLGSHVAIADSGLGTAITIVQSGGVPVSGLTLTYAGGQVAPSGFHWEFITDDADGALITDGGQPIVDLVAD